ncbi:hypothetical protein Agub_g11606 [Astrephomene gubernaculifera]|uniref:Uncharacterized protein n=1 Tax=Astrephomene gubernaculifera TaxID=47775 RepID=A0AAD3DWV3_9CHLO|nr:hypothetical protein Agub_g11606 [Astrephomene gubernaculifera]
MATTLSRLPSYLPVLRSLPVASGLSEALVDQVSSCIRHGKEGEAQVPPSCNPAQATFWVQPFVGRRPSASWSLHGGVRLGAPALPWAQHPLQGCRTFASQSEQTPQQPQAPQPQADQQQQQAGAGSAGLPRPPNDVTYQGPLSQQHKLLKRISISNTLIAFAAAPAIVAFADGISMVSRYGLATSLVFFGLITTGALHWVAHPYVHELRYSAASGQIDVRTTTLLGSSRWHTFNVDDVQPLPWNRPVATFMAKNEFYYIDVFSFPDEDLLRRLAPDQADVPQGYKDKEDEDD